MKQNVCNLIADLVDYAIRHELCEELDRVFYQNRLMAEFNVFDFAPDRAPDPSSELCTILDALCDYAIEHQIIADCGVTGRDLFDTKLMGILTPRPSQVVRQFEQLYAQSPCKATDYYYRLWEQLGTENTLFSTCFEFGTLGDDFWNTVMSMKYTVEENQNFWYPSDNEVTNRTIEERYHELFYPTEKEWREKTIEDFIKACSGVLGAKLLEQ